ncbi:MAG: hypothetical protein ABIJ00_12745 [Candidatus Eisenbacteria bacterium]
MGRKRMPFLSKADQEAAPAIKPSEMGKRTEWRAHGTGEETVGHGDPTLQGSVPERLIWVVVTSIILKKDGCDPSEAAWANPF